MAIYRTPVLENFPWQQSVKARVTAATFAALTPAKGDRYLLADGSYAGSIAYCTNATGPAWAYTTPVEGMITWIDNVNQYWHCTSSTTWIQYLGQPGSTGPAGPAGVSISSISKSSNYPITDGDGYTTIFLSGNTTITLPLASTKRIIKFVKTDAGTTTTIVRSGSDTIAGEISFTTTNQYNTTTLESDGLLTWYVF